MRILIIAAIVLATSTASAQDSTSSAADLFPHVKQGLSRKIVATGIIAGMIGTSTIWAVDAWWQGRSHPFNFYSEGWFNDYSLGMDKIGHAYTSYFYFHTFHNIMLWGGFDPSTAFWWGAGITELLAFSLEVGDGFSTFGFSYEDLVSNTLGLTYAALQTRIPWLQNFSLKWSYIPVGQRDGLNFTQHYDSHTYWLSFNIHELLPDTWNEYWPKWLQLAAGYSVDERQTRREGVIGLDLNLEILPAPSADVLLVEKTLNMFHVPAPALKFTDGKPMRFQLFQLD